MAFNHRLELNQPDKRGSTPLHWACYSQSEVALSYLLAWKGVEINARDNEGFTPLHLAVKSAESVNSSRAVRYMLIAGADTEAMDKNGLRPIDLADTVGIIDLRIELQYMLVRI
jgi:ankyrin repeat protein